MNPVKNVLFDLGKVLYDIDIDRLVANFNAMITPDKQQVAFNMEYQPEMFTLLETGKIGKEAFVEGMIEAFQLKATREEVLAAWDSILVGLIPGRVEATQHLAKTYQLGILSNTNAIHFERLGKEMAPLFASIPDENIFLSYQMDTRKPLPEIYQEVLRRTGWKAEETMFMDDGVSNSKMASDLGFQTILYESESDFDRLMEILG